MKLEKPLTKKQFESLMVVEYDNPADKYICSVRCLDVGAEGVERPEIWGHFPGGANKEMYDQRLSATTGNMYAQYRAHFEKNETFL